MFVQITDTKGIPNSCALQVGGTDGSYARCRATKGWCVIAPHQIPALKKYQIENTTCPFDKNDVIQLEYRKQKDGT